MANAVSGLALGQVVQLTGSGTTDVTYSTFNDGGGIVEGSVSGSEFSNIGTISGTTTLVTLFVNDTDLLPAGFLSGTSVVQPLGGTGNLIIDEGSSNFLSAHVAGGDFFGPNGSEGSTTDPVTMVLNLSSLSSSVLTSVPTGSAFLVLQGTTNVNMALATECLSPPSPAPPCSGASQQNLGAPNTAIKLDWTSAIVTTTAPTIPGSTPRTVQFINATVGGTYSWSNQNNWVTTGSVNTTPQPGDIVNLTNPTTTTSPSQTFVTFDATNLGTSSGSALTSLTIDSNTGGALVELTQAANTLASGSETIGTTGTAEHLQTGGVNNVSGTLTINGFGTYDLQGGTLNAGIDTVGAVVVNSGGQFFFDGGTLNFPGTFVLNSGGTVASGSPSSPGSGNGTETMSAPSFDFALFDQEGGTNTTGSLILGQTGGTMGYTLNNGTLNATIETIGAGATATFNQNGGNNNGGTLSITGCQFCAESGYTMQGGFAAVNTLQVNSNAFFLLEGTGSFNSGVGNVTGNFIQAGSSENLLVGTLTVGNGGTYDLQGGTLVLEGPGNVVINSGGSFFFDGGSTLNTLSTSIVGITLNAGGTVASGTASSLASSSPANFGTGTEIIDQGLTFTQIGGTNTAGTMTIVAAPSANAFGTYDLQGGTLNASTITVNAPGNFYFDGGTANYTRFILNGGTVASGTAATLASASSANFGTGTEIVSSPNDMEFIQNGGENNAGTLLVGPPSTTSTSTSFQAFGAYMLTNGTLTASSEAIGANGYVGVFSQTGGTNNVNGTLSITGCNCGPLSFDSSYTLGGGSAANTGGTLFAGNLVLGPGATFNLQGGAFLGAGSQTIMGQFVQSGNSENLFATIVVGSGGTYDMQSGSLIGSITVNSGGQFFFDGANPSGSFTLNAGGVVASGSAASPGNGSGTESLSSTQFVQTGGTNTTSSLIVTNASRNMGLYDLQGGMLNATNITVNNSGSLFSGSFFFDGGTANFTIFNQTGGTVASGTAASLATMFSPSQGVLVGNPANFGTGTENISPSQAGGTVTFNQSGGNNFAGALVLGQGLGQTNYNLTGGQLMASTETMGGGLGGAQFMQSNSGNTVTGLLTVGAGASYFLGSGGTLNTGSETIGGAGAFFGQTGGSNVTVPGGALTINNGGVYEDSASSSIPLLIVGSLQINGGGTLEIETGSFALVTGNAANAGSLTINGAGSVLTVNGTYNQTGTGSKSLLNGGTLDPTSITVSGGTFGGTGTVVGDMSVTGGTVQVGASPDPLAIMGNYSQTAGEITFEIDPDGKGGFLESTLVFDPGNTVAISNTDVVFDFLNGADPLAFFDAGLFNLDTFLKESDGSLFSGDFDLSEILLDDSFSTDEPSFDVPSFDPGTGALELVQQNVPEPATWWMLLSGIGFLVVIARRRPARGDRL